MAEAALFFVDYLEEKDGYLVTNPSVSPENTYILPNGEMGCCISATMDNQILRDLFRGCLGAWAELGEQEQLPRDIVEAAQKLNGGADNVAQAQQEIKDMMNKLKLVEDDVKGAAVDQGI